MLDRVTVRTEMRDELITITRMLLGKPPAVRGSLPKPEAEPIALPDQTEAKEADAKT